MTTGNPMTGLSGSHGASPRGVESAAEGAAAVSTPRAVAAAPPSLAESTVPLISPRAWAWILTLGALFIALHRIYLERLFRIVTDSSGENFFQVLISAATTKWNPDWSHALVVPFISAYFIHQHRQRLAATEKRLCWWGLPIMFAGLLAYTWCLYPVRNDMLQGYSMIVTLFGLVLFLLGPQPMTVLWFPIAYLVFAVKISDRIWDQIAWKMQQIASVSSALVLQMIGVVGGFEADRTGTTLTITFMKNGQWVAESLNVAEACSGLRMLMAFVALGVALAFLWDRPWWQRMVMIVLAVPIAIAVNMGRVVAIGLLTLVNPELAKGDFHTFVGMLMLIPAGLLFLGLGWVMDRIVIYEETPESASRGATAMTSGQAGSHRSATRARQPASDPRWFVAGPALKGAAFGVGITALLGLSYAFALATLRPDSVFEGMSQPVAVVLLAVSLAAAAAAVALLRWRMPARSSETWLNRRMVAMGLVAGMMVTVMAGQNTAIAATKTIMIKQEVPLRHQLYQVPMTSGTWKVVGEDPPLSREILETLGTNLYFTRHYEDTSWSGNRPGKWASLHVAYYTGTPDTVPHVPDRCFIAGGVRPIDVSRIELNLSDERYEPDPEHGGYLFPAFLTWPKRVRVPAKDIEATIFTYGHTGRGHEVVDNVIYFFAANGKFLPTPDHVRLQGFDPRDKYSYYCKVEVRLAGVEDPELARERAASLLSVVLPEVMACLPDWVDVTEGRWPVDDAEDTDPNG